MELAYKGKLSKKHVLDYSAVLPLAVVRQFGKEWWNGWQNMLVYGDNLEVMKSLAINNGLKGKIRLVYIDPPFATNQRFRAGEVRTSTISSAKEDGIAYEDLVVGAEYLESLRRRFLIVRELLTDDGSIYVHIDTKMGHYVKIIMDEVFGAGHFRNDIARIKSNPKNFQRLGYGNMRDMVLFYSKSDEIVWNGAFKDYTEEQIERLFPKTDEKGRRYTTNPLHAPGETSSGPTGQRWRGMSPPKGRHWRYLPDVLEDLDRHGLIQWSSTGNPRKIIYAEEHAMKRTRVQDVWEFKDPVYPVYPTEKNMDMLKMIVETSSNPDDIVMDYYCGSGSALAAAERLGRRWVGIDNSAVAIRSSLKRLQAFKRVRPMSLYTLEKTPLPQALEKAIG